MSSYIGKVQIGASEQDRILIGSTLYGICTTGAATANKIVALPDFDTKMNGITVHVKFVEGNSVTENVTLAVGSVLAVPVTGNCVCQANEVIAFTYEQISENNEIVHEYWRAERGVKIETSNNIITKIDGQDVNAATKSYVDSKTAGLDGLTGAMHFIGKSTTVITDGGTQQPTIGGNVRTTMEAGDVVLWNQQEYVWDGTNWELLGDEGSYALKSSTDTITEVSNFTTNTLPTLTTASTTASNVSVTNGTAASLTTNNVTIPIVNSVGSMTTASVSGGILTITVGSTPTFAETPITVKEVGTFAANTPTAVVSTPVTFDAVGNWSEGSQAVLNTNDIDVVVPNSGT